LEGEPKGLLVMRLSTTTWLPVLAGMVLFPQTPLRADIIDFEAFSDSTALTDQIPGLRFSNATVITAGISLNEVEFPPHSGSNVVFDDGGIMSISFSAPVLSFGGYFTYLVPLTLTAFDASSNQVGRSLSLFNSNLALSGDVGSSPNEFLSVNSPRGISMVTMTGDLGGGSFTLDDATFTPSVPDAPEPGTLILLLSAGGLIAFRRRRI
jgi:hypothetical protein